HLSLPHTHMRIQFIVYTLPMTTLSRGWESSLCSFQKLLNKVAEGLHFPIVIFFKTVPKFSPSILQVLACRQGKKDTPNLEHSHAPLEAVHTSSYHPLTNGADFH